MWERCLRLLGTIRRDPCWGRFIRLGIQEGREDVAEAIVVRERDGNVRSGPPARKSDAVLVPATVGTSEVVGVGDPVDLVPFGLLGRSGEGGAEEGGDGDSSSVVAAEDKGVTVGGGLDLDTTDLYGVEDTRRARLSVLVSREWSC
jgi:hypothetical protein